MKTLERKVEELVAKVAALERALANRPTREAQVRIPRRGWWLGVVQTLFTKSSPTDTATVEIWRWSVTDSEWQATGVEVEAIDWFLNTGETHAADVKVKVEYYDTVWVITGAYCEANDDLEA